MNGNPDRKNRKHLRRLRPFVNQCHSIYYVTMCAKDRRAILTEPDLCKSITESLHQTVDKHGWAVGAYVIMPDHLHFLCFNVKNLKSISGFLRDFKRWTSRAARNLGYEIPLWQKEFFDRLLRKNDLYYEKMEYMRMNPVRAKLCESPEQWESFGICHPLIEG